MEQFTLISGFVLITVKKTNFFICCRRNSFNFVVTMKAFILLLAVGVCVAGKTSLVASLDVTNTTMNNVTNADDDDVDIKVEKDVKKETTLLEDFDVSSDADNSTNVNSRRWAQYPGQQQQPQQQQPQQQQPNYNQQPRYASQQQQTGTGTNKAFFPGPVDLQTCVKLLSINLMHLMNSFNLRTYIERTTQPNPT